MSKITLNTTICYYLMTYFVLVLPLFFAGTLCAKESLPVKIKTLVKTSIQQEIKAFGILELTPQHLYFQTSGYLLDYFVDEGENAKKGQLLAKLDTKIIDNKIKQLQELLKLSKKRLSRTKKLKNNKVITIEQFENSENKYLIQSLKLKNLYEERKQYHLHAPGKGRILQRFTDYPTPINLTTPIFSIKADALPWKVNAELTEQEINLINRNDPVSVYFHGIANTSFSGKIDKIALHTNKNSLLEVQISLEKSSAFFRSGLNTTNTIKTQQQYQGYFVPLTVFTHLKNNSGSLFLLKKGGETVRKIAVEISIIQGVDALVSTDLSEFNRIIVAGQHNLKNGSQVYIIE